MLPLKSKVKLNGWFTKKWIGCLVMAILAVIGGVSGVAIWYFGIRGTSANNDAVLPFEDDKTWNLLTESFKIKQPEITHKDVKPAELEYLSNLFLKLGNHKADKFVSWLHSIRQKGTSGVTAPMDIEQIGKECKLTQQEHGQHIYQTFFEQTLPFMKELILRMPQIFPSKNNDDKMENVKLSFLDPNSNGAVDLTRGQVASILACCFFGIEMYAHCSFAAELHKVGTPAKMECWVRYFDFVRQKGMDSDWFNNEKVNVWRRSLTAEQYACLEYENLINNETPLSDFSVFEKGCIEDQAGALHADFANRLIGGGVLSGGNVQEEIRFTVNTECLISKWLCPLPMGHNESIIIFGSQQFFNYSGYGSSFSFDGYRNNGKEMFFCQNKPDRLASSAIIGIDALDFRKLNSKEQMSGNFMMREITKSYVGYSISNKDIGHQMDVISTGNWGAGLFRGDPQLKAMLQWISASLSGRSVAYYTFSDGRVADGILQKFIEEMKDHNFTVGRLWKCLMDKRFAKFYKGDGTVFDWIRSFF